MSRVAPSSLRIGNPVSEAFAVSSTSFSRSTLRRSVFHSFPIHMLWMQPLKVKKITVVRIAATLLRVNTPTTRETVCTSA